MQQDDKSSTSTKNFKSARKSTSALSQAPRPAGQAATGASQSPQAERKAKRPRKWTVDLRKAAKKARLRGFKKQPKDHETPEISQGPAQKKGTGFQLHELPRTRRISKNTTPVSDRNSSNNQQQVPMRTPQQNPKTPKQQPKQAAVSRAQPRSPPTAVASSKKPPERPRKTSVMNLSRLMRDGRKPPDYYREVARRALSPSVIDLKSLTEFYETPSQEFSTIDDVYTYRGYKKIAKLDEGAFGIVYKATRVGDNFAVALKEVDLSRRRSKRIEEMKRELFVLQKIDSPCIVKLVEHFIVSNTLVIVMELCAGNNLTHYLKESAIQEDEALHLFRQMASGIKIMHRAGIAHRDVKLNNFLLDSSRKTVKVADFGLSVVSYREDQGVLMAKTYCGTEPYMAPEILRRNSRGFRQYNPMYADVWALGVCLYAMLTRTFPFKMNLSQRSLFITQTARRWRIPRVLRDSISEELRDLLWHMLDPEPDRRITIIGVTTHPWLARETVTLSQVE